MKNQWNVDLKSIEIYLNIYPICHQAPSVVTKEIKNFW